MRNIFFPHYLSGEPQFAISLLGYKIKQLECVQQQMK